jgi:hypothetical protein
MDYFVLGADGKEYGPCDFGTLTQWARDNRLQPQSPVREVATGRSYTAAEIPGLFIPAAAPHMMPGQQSYNSQMPTMARQPNIGAALLWAFLDPTLAVVFFYFLHGIGLIFAVFGIINAVRVFKAKHSLGIPALIFAIVCFGIVLTGWILRGMNG